MTMKKLPFVGKKFDHYIFFYQELYLHLAVLTEQHYYKLKI
jgi:hypothetical protein